MESGSTDFKFGGWLLMKKRRLAAVLLLSLALHLCFFLFIHFNPTPEPHDVVVFEPIIYSKNGGGSRFNKKKEEENKSHAIKKLLNQTTTGEANFHSHPTPESFHEHETGEHGSGNGRGEGAAQGVDNLKAKFLHELRHRLDELKEYPSISKELGETGIVEVAFTINHAGDITESHVHKSSGKFRLDQAALKTLSKLQRFQAMPVELKIENLEIIVPLEFDLH